MYEIEKNIPIHGNFKTKYPFKKMEIGDSFIISGDEIQSIREALAQYKKRHPEKRFTTKHLIPGTNGFRADKRMYRIWRIE